MLRLLIVLMTLLVASLAAIGAGAQPMARTILAIHNQATEPTPSDTLIHEGLEMPLNHLGYRLVYRSLDQGLPPPAELADHAAVVTWFDTDIALPATFFAGAADAIGSGVKWIALGDMGRPDGPAARPAFAAFMGAMGLSSTGDYLNVTFDARITTRNADYVGLEAEVPAVMPPFQVYERQDPDLRVLLGAASPRLSRFGTEEAVLAAVGPQGGFVASGYELVELESIDRVMWLIDPFAFLKASLGRSVWPVPDTTTLSGRRIYFSHIDGDGWNNGTLISRYRDENLTSAEVILRDAITAYPDLPVSVGLVGGDIRHDPQRSAMTRASAGAIYAQPQVEIASHTMTHPFHWEELVEYDREAELADLADRRTAERSGWTDWPVPGARDAGSDYADLQGDPWRYYQDQPYSLDEEIGGALDVATRQGPEAKRAQVYLWSGDTRPGAAHIKATREAGVANLNGGDPRLDGSYPSFFYVSPLARTVGDMHQIHAAASNENTYTNLWQGPYYGQMQLAQTWEATGSPRRLRPMNLYYHMYAGERSGSLAALTRHLDLARTAEVAPVAASQYARIVDGFMAAEISRIGPLSWEIAGHGPLATVRFDDAADLEPAYAASSGVIGHARANGSMYVALDPAIDTARLTLRAAGNSRAVENHLPVLKSARWLVSDVETDRCAVSATVVGFGTPEMKWDVPDGRYEVAFSRGDQTLWQENMAARNGVLRFDPNISGLDPVSLTISCQSDGASDAPS